MTEPEYIYVKGKGWVIHGGYIATMRCGTVVQIVNRLPNLGEAFFRGWGPSDTQMRRNVEHAEAYYYYKDFNGYSTELHSIYEDPAYVTLVPL